MPVCWVASVMSNSLTPWTVAHQAPLSMEFSRQEYWSGLTCPPPGDLPDPGIEPTSLMSLALIGRWVLSSAIWGSVCTHTDTHTHTYTAEHFISVSNKSSKIPCHLKSNKCLGIPGFCPF